MPGFQIPGLPPVPTIADVARLLQLQVQLLSELPETMAELTLAVRNLAGTVEASRETVAAANRVANRLDELIEELRDPVLGLRPGIEQVSAVLEAPVVQRLPEILESVESTVLPVTNRAGQARERMARLGSWGRRVRDRVRPARPSAARLP
jgi:ABC-type transporter Mla subunit MlaD